MTRAFGFHPKVDGLRVLFAPTACDNVRGTTTSSPDPASTRTGSLSSVSPRAATPIKYLRSLRDYTLADCVPRITCPTFVCNAELDDIGASASELFAALTCPKQFVTFTEADGAGDHCEAAARGTFHDAVFTWLDDIHPNS